jgi:LacI family transcriptional regulator
MEPVNLKRLAKELNLAISTVSRALRDSYDISPETKRRVFELAQKLNYEPNPYASSLRKQKSKTVAVVIPEVANNFFSLAINGIESIAQEKGYHVLIYLTHEDYQKEVSITRHLQSGRVDGILMSVSANTEDTSHIVELHNKGIPIIFFDRVCDAIETSRITTDDYDSGFKATEHLIQSGCKQIAYLSFSSHLSITNKRMRGYLEALEHYHIKPDKKLIIQCSNDNAVSYPLLRKMLSGKKRPDGIFASVEKLAIACYHVCEELKIKIPKDMKIISFSNLETASLLNPSMTTITQPAFDIGKKAASVLFRMLEKTRMNHMSETVVLKSTLMPRESTRK